MFWEMRLASLNVKRVLLMSATVRMLWNAFVVARNCVLMKRLKFALNKLQNICMDDNMFKICWYMDPSIYDLFRSLNLNLQLTDCMVVITNGIVLLFIFCYCSIAWNCIGGVMVSVFASSAVDRGFEPRSDQTKDYKFGICCFSGKHAALRRKGNGQRLVGIMCPSRVTCLPADCCFSKLALYKSNSACWSRTERTSSNWKLTCPRHDIANKLLSWR